MRTGWPHPGALPETLDNYNKGSCEIKILYRGTGRGYGGGGRICLTRNPINSHHKIS